ncbi:MAG: hypothetical protein WBV82_08865 [Myxococcaceae bacterium]
MTLFNTVRKAVPVTAALASLTLSGCFFPKGGPPPGPLASDVLELATQRWPESTPESLEQGRQAFLASCDGCHSYPDLAHYTEDRWPVIMKRMGAKSDLSPENSDRVLQFILVARTSSAAVAQDAAK